jgi:hypothetical protein
MERRTWGIVGGVALVAWTTALGGGRAPALRAAEPGGTDAPWAEIRVVDAATGRGVPLVELATVNGLEFVTDDEGRVAFQEPGLMGRPLFVHVRSHGYEHPADGFGFRGRRVTPQAGATVTIPIERRNVAERLCRLTGEGRLRDSILLGRVPFPSPPIPGGVAGQDSVQAVPYGGRVHWFWGDTNRMSYPLGMFRTSGATTPLPVAGDTDDLSRGLPFAYFRAEPSEAEPAGFVRPMMPLVERPDGVIWIDGVCVVPDAEGRGRMVAHYSRRRGLEQELEQGIAVWDDAVESFVVARELPLGETWRRPSSHPLRFEERDPDGTPRSWMLFGAPSPNVRVPATYEAVLDPARYEAFSCLGDDGKPRVDADGGPGWRWQADLPPTGSADERRLVDAGLLDPDRCRFLPAVAGAAEGTRVRLHSGTVRWNGHRERWVLVAGEIGGTSHLGEVWYAEADAPTGPFPVAVKIVTHDRYSFYNVCHHDFLDRDGGRTIHFEGTFTRDFSGNPRPVPRADYNQVLYRLDLDAEALAPARDGP